LTNQIPNSSNNKGPITSFKFNTNSASFARKEIDLQIEALEIRIDNIIKKFTVDGNPIIAALLTLTHNQEELLGLSKGLGRVADLIGPLDELLKRKEVIELAEKDPTWLAWAFGDFDNQVDEAIDKFFDNNES
jgi:hypothetical protein